MAEVFGLVASAASLLEITLKSSRVLRDLQHQLRHAPDLILALSNETQDLVLVLTLLDDVRKSIEAARVSTTEGTAILVQLEAQLGKAKTILGDLEQLTQKLAAQTPTVQRVKWCLKRSRASELQQRLREARRSIAELVAALNSSVSTRSFLELRDARLEIQQTHAAIAQKLDANSHATNTQTALLVQQSTSQNQADVLAGFTALQACPADLASTQRQVIGTEIPAVREDNIKSHQAVARIESWMNQQPVVTPQLIADALAQLSIQDASTARGSTSLDTSATTTADSGAPKKSLEFPSSPPRTDYHSGTHPVVLNSALYVSLGLMGSRCESDCRCRCHVRAHHHFPWRLPRLLHVTLGSLFLGYTGSPLSPPQCDVEECSRGRRVRLTLRYAFPLWFLGCVVHGLVEASTAGRLTLGLVMCRRTKNQISTSCLLHQAGICAVDTVRDILRKRKASLFEVTDISGTSAMSLALSGRASWREKLDVVQSLLVVGADSNLENDYGVSPRQFAAWMLLAGLVPPEFRAELEQTLALPECVDNLGLSFLHRIVVGRCQVDLAETLQSKSPEILAQLNAPDAVGHTPLMYAASRGDVAKARVLLEAGASIDATTVYNRSAIFFVTNNSNNVDMTALFLAAGADVGIRDKPYDNTVLHCAASFDMAGMVGELLSAGASINQPTRVGNTALHLAVQYNACQAARLLCEKGADLDMVNHRGETPLMHAVRSNCHEALALLLELGANHLVVNKGDANILHYAAVFGDETTFKTLASFKLRGIDANAKTNAGWTAQGIFEDCSRVTDDLRSAFCRLLESLKGNDCYTDDDSDTDDDEFMDALEFM